MLQNRVDPFGNLINTSARGSLMGNRGLLHNDKQQVVRSFKLKAWITCKLEFKERKRIVMTPNLYTELFFLDEATSFAAGHRPCFECRREDFNKFKTSWLKGNPDYGFNEKTSVKEIDEIIQLERINKDYLKVTYEESMDNLPNGAFVIFKENPYLLNSGLMYLWSPFEYKQRIEMPTIKTVQVLTPKSVINTFKAGYVPAMAI